VSAVRRLARFAAMAALAVLGGCAGYYPAAGHPGGSAYPGSYGVPAYGHPSTQQGLVRCESQDEKPRRCAADTRSGVRMARQLSRTDCVRGRNWGYDAGGIWVDGGCRAEFALGGYGGYGDDAAQRVIRCESEDGRERHCAASLRGAALRKQVSRAPCVQGRNWRWDAGGIWVKDGCRADFAVW
jgi:hypothetical protein